LPLARFDSRLRLVEPLPQNFYLNEAGEEDGSPSPAPHPLPSPNAR
jgi:hypothetical protein